MATPGLWAGRIETWLISTQAKLLDLPLLVQFLPLYNGAIGKVVGRESDKSSKDDLLLFLFIPSVQPQDHL